MNPIHHPTIGIRGLALPLATLGLCAWHALPSLAAAWGNDLYSRGAVAAFVIWLASHYVISRHSALRTNSNHAWIIVSLLLCIAGSMCELRALQHLALAAAVPGVFGLGFTGIPLLAAAATWMPASGWFISHMKAGGLIGWERPAAAAISALAYAFLIRRFRASQVHQSLNKP